MSHLFGRSANGLHHHKARRSPLPFNHTGSSALNEKLLSESDGAESSYTLLFLPLPFSNPRRKLRLVLPLPPRVSRRLLRPRALLVLLGAVAILFLLLGRGNSRKPADNSSPKKSVWQNPFSPDTNVFSREELRSIWEWEVMSGHYPSARKGQSASLLPGRPYSLVLSRRASKGSMDMLTPPATMCALL
jgi:WD repeat and SOF domain-containing protein 1